MKIDISLNIPKPNLIDVKEMTVLDKDWRKQSIS